MCNWEDRIEREDSSSFNKTSIFYPTDIYAKENGFYAFTQTKTIENRKKVEFTNHANDGVKLTRLSSGPLPHSPEYFDYYSFHGCLTNSIRKSECLRNGAKVKKNFFYFFFFFFFFSQFFLNFFFFFTTSGLNLFKIKKLVLQ